ncbi:uncharacterized protein Z518_06401 [Rhinocladiella mackenziei CBS 650.93]|uniref:DUF2415 domain-containing protein n=1 Tax=Rhinocladiella mackenziei CBS 650.93 TaxID=1442369 RepID=A0A0D2IIH6_9EURO|nr:uncharacterized protein Z518_06401 [Rhinocladiella mackenziei CBS 650.93]KIX05529.1 hypothetical protein Z518_06401 [Rhinocladiella mackenziei CBS 650.93]
MIVPKHELCLTPTQGLATPHKFYPTEIHVPHHQLRHFISTSEGDLIYYVTNHDIFVLDLATQQNSLIATIPFEARCLAADLGWVCVGGEVNGDCAFIEVEKDEHGRPTCFGHDLVIDLLGGEIVNSMNIHTVANDGKTPDEPVVLISNNDKSVKIYSLAQRQVLTTLAHPVPMNFAAMSPDSTIIAAVGDSDKVYFYRRRPDEDLDLIDGSSGRYAKYDWQLMAEPTVPTGDPVYDDFSFAVAFSPSGHLCAASSQGGSITVFDMQRLLDTDEPAEKSILCNFKSSRPTLWGCVRAMAFSPAPWDILAWAEDHGRIGLADVRRYFVRRQVLELDQQKAEMVELDDGTPVAYRNLGIKERLKQQHLARLRTIRGLSSRDRDGELSIDDLPTESGARHNRQDLLTYHQSLDLDARERSVIEALETTMDNVEHLTTRPYSINYSSSPRLRGSMIFSDASRRYDVQLLNPGSRSSGARSHQPRRRTSVVLSESSANGSRYLDPNESQRTRLSASPGRISDDDEIPVMSTNDLTPSTRSNPQLQSSNIPPSDPWHVIQSALETARESDNSNRVNLARIEAALEAERQLANQLERQLADERQLSTLLRRQLDNQQRLLMENSTQLDHLQAAARESNSRVEASVERLLQRPLANEQQFLQQRSQELQSELRLGTDYSRRLALERDRLLGGDSGTESTPNTHPTNSESTSAQTSTLPTMNLRSSETSDNASNILTDYTESRSQRLAHIENLQRQVRRAESRVALATSDIQALENAIRREISAEDGDRRRNDEGNRQGRSTNNTTDATNNETSNNSDSTRSDDHRSTGRRSQMAMNPVRESRVESRISELSGRVPDSDMRLARMMFLSGLSGNRSLDGNGNWMPGSSLHRVLAGASSLSGGSTSNAVGQSPVTAADAVREMGPGTAGIGFSPDGQFLYAGSEEGIFEFKINLRDRMMFPAFEMR